jgi:hypothetical protein
VSNTGAKKQRRFGECALVDVAMVRDGAKDDNDQQVSSGLADPATAAKEESHSSPSSASAVTNDENVAPHVAIIATLERQCAAWNAGDIKAYMNGYAEDAIYISQSILKTRKRASATEKENDDICLHGRIAIETLFADILERSRRQHLGRLSYRTLQIQYATTERAFVMGRYEFVTSNNDHKKVVDAGVFTLDMAREYVAATATAGGSNDDDDEAREWKIKTEHASSSLLLQRK